MILEKNTHIISSDLRSNHQMDLVATLSMLDNIDENGVSDPQSRYLMEEVSQVFLNINCCS